MGEFEETDSPFQNASQQDSRFMGPEDDPGHGGMSGLSVAALVCSLILCCPVSTLVSVFLGIAGLVQTRGGRRRGRGMAITGIILGILFTAGWIIGARMGWSMMLEVVLRGPDLVLQAGFKGDPGEAKSYFETNSVPTDAEIDQFITTARNRYGEFLGATIIDDNSNPQGQQFTIPFNLVFTKETLKADVEFRVNENALTESGSVIGLKAITIIDKEDGDLILEANEPEEESATKPGGP